MFHHNAKHNTDEELHVAVGATLKERLPKYSRYIPGVLVRWLERTIRQDELNGILERTRGKHGAGFCRAVLKDLGVTYDVKGGELLPKDRRVIIVSNHPLGALDGIVMIDWIHRVYGGEVKFVVNDLLMAVKPLKEVFLPVNKHGRQSREATTDVDEYFAGDDPIIIFPAGLVSRKGKKGVRDLKWQKMFINKAVQYGRDIIPVYFDGRNSSFFYNFAKLRTRLGLKFNIEMIYLPREIFKSRNAHFTLKVGNPLSHTIFRGGKQASEEARRVKRMVYNLKTK